METAKYILYRNVEHELTYKETPRNKNRNGQKLNGYLYLDRNEEERERHRKTRQLHFNTQWNS